MPIHTSQGSGPASDRVDMHRPRSGKVQGLALAALALLILAGVAVLFLQSPAPTEPEVPEEAGSSAQAPPERGQLEGNPELGRTEAQDPERSAYVSAADQGGELGAIGAPVTGRVVNEGGQGVPEAKVWLTERFKFGQTPPQHPVQEEPRLFRITDARGAFRFDQLEAGKEMELWAWHPDYAARSGIAFAALGTEPQELPPIVLAAGGVVKGVVQDTGGNPIQATVELGLQDRQNFRLGSFEEQRAQDQRLGRLRSISTDERGRFEFRGVAEGTIWALRAVAEGYATAELPAVYIQPGKTLEDQLLVMGTEHRLTGVVLTDERTPVGGALITVSRTQPRPVFSAQARSEADGSFTIRGLPQGYYGLAATLDGYGYGRVPRVETNSAPVEVVLPKKGGVSGRVTDAGGAPIAQFTLELMRSRSQLDQLGPTELSWNLSDASGAYRLEGLDPGTFVLLARAPGHCPTYSPSFTVQRDVVLGIDVQMSTGGGVTGIVQTADGKPLAGAKVSLHGPRWNPPTGDGFFGQDASDPDNVPSTSAVSGADGRFTIEHAVPGSMRLYVTHARHLAESAAVEIRDGAIADAGAIRLYSGASILGVVVDEKGGLVSGATVNVLMQDGDPLATHSALTDARGRFRIDALRAGNYELMAFPAAAEWLFPVEEDVQRVYLADGKEHEVRLVARSGSGE